MLKVRRVHGLFLAGVALATLMGMAQPLMPCPDCRKRVSRWALMCPACGYVVLPLEMVLDLETLVFSLVSTNQPIGNDMIRK